MAKALSSYYPSESIAAIIQVGISNPAHFHFGYLTKAQAQTLISRNTLSYDYQDNDWIETNNPGIDIVTTDVNMHTHTVRVNFNNFTGEFFIVASTIPAGHEGRILMQDSTYAGECTLAQMDTKIAQNELHAGTLYKITGVDTPLYGGTDIFLTALTSNKLSPDGYGVFYNPKYNQEVAGYGIWDVNHQAPDVNIIVVKIINIVGIGFEIGENVNTDTGSGSILNIFDNYLIIGADNGENWNTDSPIVGQTTNTFADIESVYVQHYELGDTTIWGGKVWTNLTGNVGTKIDDLTLSDDWVQGYMYNPDNWISYEDIRFTGDLTSLFLKDKDVKIYTETFGYLGDAAILNVVYNSDENYTSVTLNTDTGEDSYYVLVPYFNAYDYNQVIDPIVYDYTNDLIIERQEPQYSNIVNFNKSDLDFFQNPIKYFQWGNGFTTNKGIGGQTIKNSFNENLNFRGIFQKDITVLQNSIISGNIFDIQSDMEYITFLNKCQFNNNIFINSSFRRNTLNTNCEFNENNLENVDLSFNTFLNYSNFYSNILKNASISYNTFIHGYFYDNILSDLTMTGCSFDNSSSIDSCNLEGNINIINVNFSSTSALSSINKIFDPIQLDISHTTFRNQSSIYNLTISDKLKIYNSDFSRFSYNFQFGIPDLIITDAYFEKNTILYNFKITPNGANGNGQQNISFNTDGTELLFMPKNSFIEEVYIDIINTIVGDTIHLGIASISGDEGLNDITGNITMLNNNITTRVINTNFVKTTTDDYLVITPINADMTDGSFTVSVKLKFF